MLSDTVGNEEEEEQKPETIYAIPKPPGYVEREEIPNDSEYATRTGVWYHIHEKHHYKLFFDGGSQPCRAVLALIKANEKEMTRNGAKWEIVNTRLSKGENRKPEFVAINPNKYVPALQVIIPGEDEPFNLYESHAIMKYICAHKSLDDHWYPVDENKDIKM